MMRPINNNTRIKAEKRGKRNKAPRTRGAKGPGGWKKYQGAIIALVLIGAATGTILTAGYYLGWFGANITPGVTGPYSISVHDGYLDATLNNDDFAYDLWGTNDSTDWSAFDHIEGGLTLDSVKASDMDLEDYQEFYINMTGSVAHDEDIYDIDLGTRTYGERWFRIYNDRANSFATYETPNNVFMLVLFGVNGSQVNLSISDVDINANLSIVVGNNVTQTDAMYVPYFDYAAQETVQINIIVTFDDFVVKNDFKIDGLSGTHSLAWGANGTTMYDLGGLTPGFSLYSGLWRAAADITSNVGYITGMELFWGTTSLVALP